MVQGQKSSFSTIGSVVVGEPFVILATDDQTKSAEFMQYAVSIANRLQKHGWYEVATESQAKYAVLLDFGISGSSQKITSMPTYGTTSTTVYPSYGGSAFSLSTYGFTGNETYSTTVHARYFEMKIFDIKNLIPVYETKVSSEGESATFGQVSECLFDIGLSDFPKATSQFVTVNMHQCGS